MSNIEKKAFLKIGYIGEGESVWTVAEYNGEEMQRIAAHILKYQQDREAICDAAIVLDENGDEAQNLSATPKDWNLLEEFENDIEEALEFALRCSLSIESRPQN